MREAMSKMYQMVMSRGIVRTIMCSRDIQCGVTIKMKTEYGVLTSTSLSTCSVEALITIVATVVSSSCCWANTMTLRPPTSLTSILNEGEEKESTCVKGVSGKKKKYREKGRKVKKTEKEWNK